MRGYGKTDAPNAVTSYTTLHSVGDMVAILDAFNIASAVIVGHDWGAPVAWTAAMVRPDRFRAVVGVAVPYVARGAASDLDVWRHAGRNDFYQLYFQNPGVAEENIQSNLDAFLKGLFWSLSGKVDDEHRWTAFVPKQGFLASLSQPPQPLTWISKQDLDVYKENLTRTGLRGPLSWYRNIDLNWQLHAFFEGQKITQPALFICGNRDPIYTWLKSAIDSLPNNLPNLRDTVVLPDIGHWIQQEDPTTVNASLINFLNGL
ncbi:haloalkane dehalogenase [Gluconobacter japonicus]|nr:haloalkane dehalogenase [Gluconobacter japonicus]